MARRLAAILAVDMVGSSRLMEADEVGTLAAFKGHREQLIEPLIADHDGRIVKLTGDGALVEFASVVDAVTCALAIQNGMVGRNRDVPGDRRILFRIGVHLGDVMIEEEDIYGDGVNVAARLEGLAEPGGICISQQALDQVETKLDLSYDDMGEQRLKNIARPIRTWQVRTGGETRRSPARRWRKAGAARLFAAASVAVLIAVGGVAALWPGEQPDISPLCPAEERVPLAERPAIAVLPFDNLRIDPEQEYFAFGIAEDLVTDLSKVCNLRIVPSDVSFPYGGRGMVAGDIAEALGVRYLVTGNLRRDANRVRINARLLAPAGDGQIWADRYDRDFDNMFALLDDVLERIVGSLAIEITENERQRIAARGTDSIAAHDLYMQARRHESTFTQEGHREAMRLYERALSIDPGYALAYARMGNILELNTRAGWSDDIQADLGKAVELARKAVDLDPRDPKNWWGWGRATARLRTPEALAEGIEAMLQAIRLEPEFADAHAYLGVLYVSDRRADLGLASVAKAMEFNPRYPSWYLLMRGICHFCLEDYQSAIADLEAARDINPEAFIFRWVLTAAYAEAERVEDAEWEVEELSSRGIERTIGNIIEAQPIQDPKCLAAYREGLRKAGIPE